MDSVLHRYWVSWFVLFVFPVAPILLLPSSIHVVGNPSVLLFPYSRQYRYGRLVPATIYRHVKNKHAHTHTVLYSCGTVQVSIGVLFWQFANDIVPVAQAKRFYPLFGQMSSLATVLAGLCVMRFTGGASGSGEKSKAVSDGLVDYVMVRHMPAIWQV